MMNSQRSDVQKINLIEKGKKQALMKLLSAICLKCKKDTKNINPRFSSTSNNKTMLLLKCAKCSSKKSRYIKNQEAKGLLSNLVIRTH